MGSHPEIGPFDRSPDAVVCRMEDGEGRWTFERVAAIDDRGRILAQAVPEEGGSARPVLLMPASEG